MASLFFDKMQIANETKNYMIFPINWLMHQIYFEQVSHIYALFVRTTIAGLRISRKDLIPLLPSLQQWMTSLITIPTQPPLPPILLHFPNFPTNAITLAGQEIHKAWFSMPTGLARFIDAMVKMPSSIARAFGFANVVYIFDHFDCCSLTIAPPPQQQTQQTAASEQPQLPQRNEVKVSDVNFAPLICEMINTAPFFVASQDDQLFFNVFNIEKFTQVPTERLIKKLPEREIIVVKPNLTIDGSLTRGCPGYVSMYERLCDMVQEASDSAVVKSQFARFRSVIDITRAQMIKEEFYRISTLLAAAADSEIDSDGNEVNTIDLESMNLIAQIPEIDIRIR